MLLYILNYVDVSYYHVLFSFANFTIYRVSVVFISFDLVKFGG